MDPADIPASITNLSTRAPWITPNSPKAAAKVLAYYWPAIEQHIRAQIADEFTRHGRTQETFTWGEATLIARGKL